MTQTASSRERHAPLVVLAAGRATRYGGVKPLAPVGVGGEAVIDVLASDALAAGFQRIVLVIGEDTGAAVRYHVERTWPDDVDVRFSVQHTPDGTVGAVCAAASALDPASHFAVANADDLPSVGALASLAAHLSGEAPTDVLVSFRLADTVIGSSPVTRGLCTIGDDGTLLALEERRHVTPLPDGRFVADDGRQPRELDPDQPVSVNLWGFSPAMHEVFAAAMAVPSSGEVLLPDVVHHLLVGRADGVLGGGGARHGGAGRFRIDVLRAAGRCIGVTHADDVPLVTAALAREVGRGERPATLWTSRPATRSAARLP
jgi:CTP:molybdopterin cytidylyltransferase MocA